nr:CotY/CotZ family spore coat protein [Fredinandcohnia onubensis]
MSLTNRNCVSDAIEAILDAQEAVEEKCATSCYQNLLDPDVRPGRDTIPFLLYTEKGDVFSAFGNVGVRNDCFRSPFFRVENLRGNCATLTVLEPDREVCDNETGECDVCDVRELRRTDFCIEVDLSCFCAIQCLSPDLVVRQFSRKGGKD